MLFSTTSNHLQQEPTVRFVGAAYRVRIVERRVSADKRARGAQHPEKCRPGTDKPQERSRHQRNDGAAMRSGQRLAKHLQRFGIATHADLRVAAGHHDDQQEWRRQTACVR